MHLQYMVVLCNCSDKLAGLSQSYCDSHMVDRNCILPLQKKTSWSVLQAWGIMAIAVAICRVHCDCILWFTAGHGDHVCRSLGFIAITSCDFRKTLWSCLQADGIIVIAFCNLEEVHHGHFCKHTTSSQSQLQFTKFFVFASCNLYNSSPLLFASLWVHHDCFLQCSGTESMAALEYRASQVIALVSSGQR